MGQRVRTGVGVRARGSRGRLVVAGLCAFGLVVAGAQATHLAIDTEGHTTLEQILVESDPDADYTTLEPEAVDEEYLVRDGVSESDPSIANAQAGRELRRRSLAYVSQMTDFQLADEESPARVEFLDGPLGQAGPPSSWRPWEALGPFMVDASVRQINRFAPASPVPQGDGSGNAMDLALITGDQADNQQRNETVWVRELLEGGTPLNFNSGLSNAADYANPVSLGATCAALVLLEGGAAGAAAEGGRYTGVQDFDDYPLMSITDPPYWDPDDVTGDFATAGWPSYPGLMDRAQSLTITPEGLDVPFYITNGNHDVLMQGNEDANAAFESLATGCFKPLLGAGDPANGLTALLVGANVGMLVPPDPQRQITSKPQVKQIYGAAIAGDDDHGFKFVDTAELSASDNSASYYAWDPAETPGVRFVNVDTNSEGGILGPFGPQPTGSSNGNIDDPQFQWLVDELDAAQAAGKLIVVWGHHPIRTIDAFIPDEAAAPCTANDAHGHDVNPGCDVDPRSSLPLHLGTPEQAAEFGSSDKTLSELLSEYPNVVAYVSGHTHENKIIPYPKQGPGTWWEIGTSAVADYPQQSRLIELMDNRDRTLSIFGTVLEHASPATAPAPGNASGFTNPQLASIGRTIAYNDFQIGGPALDFQPLGELTDQNVELLLRDPREADLFVTLSDQPDPVSVGNQITYRARAINGGPSIATGVRLTDDLPAGVDVVSAAPQTGTCSESGGEVACDLGDIPSGATRQVEIVVTARQQGTLLNRAMVEGILTDPDGADDRATEETTVTGAGGGGGLSRCKGVGAIKGTNGPDNMKGSKQADSMQGLRGEDRIRGRKGTDGLCGGRGADTIKGGRGGDTLKGNRGSDLVNGGRGGDTVKGNRGGDRVNGGRGGDRVMGKRGGDILIGGPGFDICRGGPGNDVAFASCEEVHSARRGSLGPHSKRAG